MEIHLELRGPEAGVPTGDGDDDDDDDDDVRPVIL